MALKLINYKDTYVNGEIFNNMQPNGNALLIFYSWLLSSKSKCYSPSKKNCTCLY